MLRVVRVEHLPTAMDGDFDAMVSIHQRKWEEDWEHPLGGKWVGNEKRLGRTETKQTHPAKYPTVVFSTTTPGDTTPQQTRLLSLLFCNTRRVRSDYHVGSRSSDDQAR